MATKETKPKAAAKAEKPKTSHTDVKNAHKEVKHAEGESTTAVSTPKKEASTKHSKAQLQPPSTEDKTMQHIKLHGKEFVGVVTSDKAAKTVTVEWERRRLIQKYERYERRYSRVYAHNPVAINAKIGDKVRIKETRPLSKTKHFVVVEVIQ